MYTIYIYVREKKCKMTKTVWSGERKEPTHSERILHEIGKNPHEMMTLLNNEDT